MINIEVEKFKIETIIPALEREKAGKLDSALDLIFDDIDTLLWKSEWQLIDGIIEYLIADIQNLSIDMLLCYLVVTLPANLNSKKISKLFVETSAIIKSRGDWEDGLMDGLE